MALCPNSIGATIGSNSSTEKQMELLFYYSYKYSLSVVLLVGQEIRRSFCLHLFYTDHITQLITDSLAPSGESRTEHVYFSLLVIAAP